MRQQQGKLRPALADLSTALGLMQPAAAGGEREAASGGSPPAEMLRTYP